MDYLPKASIEDSNKIEKATLEILKVFEKMQKEVYGKSSFKKGDSLVVNCNSLKTLGYKFEIEIKKI